jgi:hypothetical protein
LQNIDDGVLLGWQEWGSGVSGERRHPHKFNGRLDLVTYVYSPF